MRTSSKENIVEEWQRTLVAVFDLAGGRTDRIVHGIEAADRGGLGHPDPTRLSDALDGAARYLKERGLVTGETSWHADLRLTEAGAAEARRLLEGRARAAESGRSRHGHAAVGNGAP